MISGVVKKLLEVSCVTEHSFELGYINEMNIPPKNKANHGMPSEHWKTLFQNFHSQHISGFGYIEYEWYVLQHIS